MAVVTLEDVLAQANQLPLAERKVLKAKIKIEEGELPASLRDLDKPSKSVAAPFASIDRTQEYEWLKQHRHAYIGQWVALVSDQLLAHSFDHREVFAQVKALGLERPYLLFVEDPNVPFAGM